MGKTGGGEKRYLRLRHWPKISFTVLRWKEVERCMKEAEDRNF